MVLNMDLNNASDLRRFMKVRRAPIPLVRFVELCGNVFFSRSRLFDWSKPPNAWWSSNSNPIHQPKLPSELPLTTNYLLLLGAQ